MSSVCFCLYLLCCWRGIFGNCLLAAPELIKALPSPSCLARSGFGDWSKRWVTTYRETKKPSCYTPWWFAVGHTHKKKVLKLFCILAGCKGKHTHAEKQKAFQMLTCNLIEKTEEHLNACARLVSVLKGKWRGLVDPVIQIHARDSKSRTVAGYGSAV